MPERKTNLFNGQNIGHYEEPNTKINHQLKAEVEIEEIHWAINVNMFEITYFNTETTGCNGMC